MNGPIAIAVSGGIDSLVSAYLLKNQGHDIYGVHFITGYERQADPGAREIQSIGKQMGMPVMVFDLKTPFKTMVVDYFAAAYQNGETPNPCLVCNPLIKFGLLMQAARHHGAAQLATGHYARVARDSSGLYRLYKGTDAGKDQSYFLSRLTQDQLARACFPLGTWTKDQVRELAAANGFEPVNRQESQDVCFIRDDAYADFLVRTAGIRPQSGDIVDTAGRRVGTHNGLHRFTVGQRRGINCPASQAYYVIRIDMHNNRLIVGFKDQLVSRHCRVRDINWIAGAPDGPVAVDSRIRYRHKAVASMLTLDGNNGAVVHFDQPQSAVTPGQGAVFYRGDEVIGGGWITAG